MMMMMMMMMMQSQEPTGLWIDTNISIHLWKLGVDHEP